MVPHLLPITRGILSNIYINFKVTQSENKIRKYFKEFYIKKSVYGEKYKKDPVFFQRHYDLDSIKDRLIKPSGLQEKERIFLGEYNFQFCEKFMILPWPIKPIKLFYQWATPFFARRFLSYRDYPVSRPDMHMYTSSCICMVLMK